MNTTLEKALAKVAELPDEAQERIGLDILDRLATMKSLQADLDVGLQELDAGFGRPLDVEEVIRRGKERIANR